MLINIDSISNIKIHSHPYGWGMTDQTFRTEAIATELRASFPTSGFKCIERLSGSKQYLSFGTAFVPRGESTSEGTIWDSLAQELQSDAYRQAIETCTGVTLEKLSIEITMWRQTATCFLGPHTDKSDKVVTHLLYFSDPYWSPEMGGCLRILNSSDIDDAAAEIPPRLGYSVILIRSEHSWHGYYPINDDGMPRLSLQITFHHPNLSYSQSFTSVH